MTYNEEGRWAWLEIDTAAITYNIKKIRKRLDKNTQIMAVVKASAYGHGLVEVGKVALQAGVERLSVATMGEAALLRESNIAAPILVMGYTPADLIDKAINFHIAQTVFDYETAVSISRVAAMRNITATIHIKVDTGMGRLGFAPDEAITEIGRITALPHIFIEGIFSHFANADKEDTSYSINQINCFNKVLSTLDKQGLLPPLRHMANSPAVFGVPGSYYNTVRVGQAMYGYGWGDKNSTQLGIHPALSLKSRIIQVKTVPPGTYISYGSNFCTKQESLIATIPIGYADGVPRLLSNRGEALLAGKRVPMVGNICMDQIMLDITGVDAAVGDEVVLIGKQNGEQITIEEVAAKTQTISYEICSGFSQRLLRVYK